MEMKKKSENERTQVLQFVLSILALAGCWRPFSWSSANKQILYNVYTLLVISLMYSFTFSQFMEIVLNVDNPDDFTNILYTLMAMIAACYKVFTMWMNHESFAVLIYMLTEGTFRPLVPAEREIRRKFDKMIRDNVMAFSTLIGITCAGNILISLLTNFRNRKLTFPEWIPYDYSSFVIYCLTYTLQYIRIFTGAFVNLVCDSLIVGLLLHVCCQITILNYRLKNITDHYTLSYCVRHHYDIIVYAQMVNAKFTRMILFQFVMSTLLVCANLYQLTRTTISVYHISLITYTLSVMAEILLYCWFGNQLKVTSQQVLNTIFEMEWTELDNKMKKSLLIVMNRAMIPIEFTCAYLLNMNLDSFVGLLKLSYSAYNLLVRMQET